MVDSTFDIVTDEAGFLALETEWEILRMKVRDQRYSQSFAWFRLGWETTGRPRGRRLFILVMRVQGNVVLIWPLAIRHNPWLWKVAGPLGPEWTEYDSGLVEALSEAAKYVQKAIIFLRRNCPADLILVHYCCEGEPLNEAIAFESFSYTACTVPSPYLSFEQFIDWTSYWKTRDYHMRSNIDRRSRRFSELGVVTFDLVDNQPEFDDLLTWTLCQKIDWMVRTGSDNNFLRKEEFALFLRKLYEGSSVSDGLKMFVIKLDGRPVATNIGTLCANRYEIFITARDPEFSRYGTGMMILVACMKWCQQRGLDFDFRIGGEEYKLKWSTSDRTATSYRLAISYWGRVLLKLKVCQDLARISFARLRP